MEPSPASVDVDHCKLAADRRSVDQETGFKPSKLVLVLSVMVIWRVFTLGIYNRDPLEPEVPGVWTRFRL